MRAKPNASYEISVISLKYEIVTHPDLERHIALEYQNMALLFNRVLRHRQISVNKSETTWNWSLNMSCKSLKGILVLLEAEQLYTQNTSNFYNPKIRKVSVIVEASLISYTLKACGRLSSVMRSVRKGSKRTTTSMRLKKHLQPHDLSVGEYLTNRYALWLDFRMIDENALHGMGRRIENASEGITLQIEKNAEVAGALKFTLT